MDRTVFPFGCYVKVIRTPDPWESSGESDDDRADYVGHVGLVVEGPDGQENPLYLVRFPSHKAEAAGQRNIERSALGFVSDPVAPICDTCLEG